MNSIQNSHCKKEVADIEGQRLTLAFESLEQIPPVMTSGFASSIRILDLSHNKFSSVGFLKNFPRLTSLILDHNQINSATEFPNLPSLTLLWLNHNQISRLFPFVHHLRSAFPNIRHLSLMANPAVPVHVDDSTFYHHLQYRLFMISWFSTLEHLDDLPVNTAERAEAERLYKRPLLERLMRSRPMTTAVSRLRGVRNLLHPQTHHRGDLRSSFV